MLVLAALVAVFADFRPAAAARHGSGGDVWVTSWSASPQVSTPDTLAAFGFDKQTVRDIICSSVGGSRIRLELTNQFGTSPLRVGHVTVAVAGMGAAVAPGTIHQVRLDGRASFEIPAGAQVLSDPVAMSVAPLQDLAVSLYLPDQTRAATFHLNAQQVNWISTPGDHAANAGPGAFTSVVQSWYYVSGLVVHSPGVYGTVVAFGDSITDGVQSTIGGNARWPNDLARRLDAVNGPTLAVADEGIGGNRVLAGSRCCGASAEARFERDGHGLWALEVRQTGEFIGFAGLAPLREDVPGGGGTEIGWRLARHAWHQGYATEAARAALAVAFDGIGLNEIWSMTAVLNEPSQAVMRRLGLTEVARFNHPRVPAGHPLRPHVTYHRSRSQTS